jgi:hypothetical protein
MQEAEDSWAWDAHAESGGSTTELSVTEYYRGRGGDVKIYREVSKAVCPIPDLGCYRIRTGPQGSKEPSTAYSSGSVSSRSRKSDFPNSSDTSIRHSGVSFS